MSQGLLKDRRSIGCPKCGHYTRVISLTPRYYGTRRRRECATCLYRFNTDEIVSSDDRIATGVGPENKPSP